MRGELHEGMSRLLLLTAVACDMKASLSRVLQVEVDWRLLLELSVHLQFK
jgi:hypothetical protein